MKLLGLEDAIVERIKLYFKQLAEIIVVQTRAKILNIYVCVYINVYINVLIHIYFCSFPGTDWPKIKHSSVPKKFVLISCVFRTIYDYEAFPKDLGMGVVVGNAVIGVRGRDITSAQ